MGIQQIYNPAVAFSSAGQDNVFTSTQHTIEAVAAGVINTNTAVYLTYSSATGILSATAATAAQIATCGGFALAAGVTNQVIPVCVLGIAQVAGGATVAAGAVFSIGASGWTAAASTVIGSNWGIAIEAQVPGGLLYNAYIARM